MDLIQNQRKEFYLVNKGYLFVKDKDLSDGRSFWKCKENGQSRKSCRVRLHCIDGQIIEEKGEHTHAPDAAEVDAKRAQAILREQASTTVDPSQLVVANTLYGLGSSAVARMATTPNLKRTIQRVRTLSAGIIIH